MAIACLGNLPYFFNPHGFCRCLCSATSLANSRRAENKLMSAVQGNAAVDHVAGKGIMPSGKRGNRIAIFLRQFLASMRKLLNKDLRLRTSHRL